MRRPPGGAEATLRGVGEAGLWRKWGMCMPELRGHEWDLHLGHRTVPRLRPPGSCVL